DGYIDGTRPYFFSVGQSGGPIRSNPLIPRRAASRQLSSSVAPPPHTPRGTPCLNRPLSFGRAGRAAAGHVCWPRPPAPPTTTGAVSAPRKSLRRIRSPPASTAASAPELRRRKRQRVRQHADRRGHFERMGAAAREGELDKRGGPSLLRRAQVRDPRVRP